MSNPEQINKVYYDKLYRRKQNWLQLIHPWISYDQQSKSKDNYQMVKPLVQAAREQKQALSVLDYGFGHGTFLLKFPAWVSLYGCDISSEAVNNFPAVARSYRKTVTTFLPENWDELPAEVSFDLICLSHILEHVEDDLALLKQLAERLSPGGRILINVPINEIWLDPKHVRAYDKNSVSTLLSQTGLTLSRIEEKAQLVTFFMKHELLHEARGLKKYFFKMLRLLLAIVPQSWNDFISNRLPNSFKPYHLLALAQKPLT